MTAEILVIGTHPGILATILRLLNNRAGWCATGVASATEAITIFNTKAFNIVLLGAGIDDPEAQALRAALAEMKPGIPCINHYGGGSGLLFAEIMEALEA